jgi:hypothetical protein
MAVEETSLRSTFNTMNTRHSEITVRANYSAMVVVGEHVFSVLVCTSPGKGVVLDFQHRRLTINAQPYYFRIMNLFHTLIGLY